MYELAKSLSWTEAIAEKKNRAQGIRANGACWICMWVYKGAENALFKLNTLIRRK